MIDVLVVAVEGPGPDLAVEASGLRRIIDDGAWTGDVAVDLCSTLGCAPREPSARLAVVDTHGTRALMLSGRVSLERLAPADVCPLPAVFASLRFARSIRGIAFAGRPMLVITPDLFVEEASQP